MRALDHIEISTEKGRKTERKGCGLPPAVFVVHEVKRGRKDEPEHLDKRRVSRDPTYISPLNKRRKKKGEKHFT